MSGANAYLVGLSLMAGQVENPRTVNGAELGSVEDYQDRGPRRICLANTSIELGSDETATLQYAGIHHASIRISVANGYFDLAYGDAWAREKQRQIRVIAEKEREVYRRGRGASVTYIFRVRDPDGYVSFPVRVSGPVLTGDGRDLKLLGRISLYPDDPPDCERHYRYGWAMLFGDEPLSTGKKE